MFLEQGNKGFKYPYGFPRICATCCRLVMDMRNDDVETVSRP